MKYSEKGVYDTIPAQAMRQKSTEYSNAEQCMVGVMLLYFKLYVNFLTLHILLKYDILYYPLSIIDFKYFIVKYDDAPF